MAGCTGADGPAGIEAEAFGRRDVGRILGDAEGQAIGRDAQLREALPDAETVLLVDNDQAEPLVLDASKVRSGQIWRLVTWPLANAPWSDGFAPHRWS